MASKAEQLVSSLGAQREPSDWMFRGYNQWLGRLPEIVSGAEIADTFPQRLKDEFDVLLESSQGKSWRDRQVDRVILPVKVDPRYVSYLGRQLVSGMASEAGGIWATEIPRSTILMGVNRKHLKLRPHSFTNPRIDDCYPVVSSLAILACCPGGDGLIERVSRGEACLVNYHPGRRPYGFAGLSLWDETKGVYLVHGQAHVRALNTVGYPLNLDLLDQAVVLSFGGD